MRAKAGIFAIFCWFVFVASCSPGTDSPAYNTGGSGPSTAGTAAGAAAGTGGAATCASGLLTCGSACVNAQTDFQNCGTCGTKCGDGQSCMAGKCVCAGGLTGCGTTCANLTSDGANCGTCGTACTNGLLCSQTMCVSSCALGEMACGNSCAVLASDPTNCGFCGNKCMGGQTCNDGACGCGAGKATCAGVCVDVSSDPVNCGACGKACAVGQTCSGSVCGGGTGTGGTGAGGTGAGGTAGTGGTGPVVMRPNGCAVTPGLIADFEDGAPMPVVIASEDRSGAWENFDDKTATSPTLALEPSGGTADCDKVALHVKGSGFKDWGAGFGFSLVGAADAPTPYNATQHQFTGIRFKAKLGSADIKSPVRFNISTPWTEDKANPGGQCAAVAATDNKAGVECYQHAGKFLSPGAGENELGTDWKTITLCFDRDLYPLSLPSNLTTEQRNNIASNMLKVQFQFNQGKDYSGAYTTEYPSFAKSLPFDFWIDDVSFFSGECPNMVASPSNGSPAKAFPQNTPVGSCMPATNAPKFAANIAKAYAQWTKNFVQGDHIVAPEQQNAVTSEALGYGMMIAAAMGDKAAFDKFHGYVKSHGGSGSGLMTWKDGGNGSASDGDIDIAYALYMGNVQWPSGGYKGAADSMASAIASQDLEGSGAVSGGSTFHQAPFNASYFAPAAFRVFGAAFTGAITENFRLVNANVTGATSGIPTDWANKSSGAPSDKGEAQVVSDITDGTNGAMGYDAARVPWRLGLDVCKGGGNTTALKAIVDLFASKYDAGASIDLMKAGWYKKDGKVHPNAKDLQGSYIGPMGVGGMAMNNAAMRDRAFRVMLDILESGDFNHTYFPTTVGLYTLLALSGNFPAP
jgi:endo-1,4-beta-D-glucanase Y